MENVYDKKIESELNKISRDEEEIIHDIRDIDFGRLVVFIQNGIIISKEITKTIKNKKDKNKTT